MDNLTNNKDVEKALKGIEVILTNLANSSYKEGYEACRQHLLKAATSELARRSLDYYPKPRQKRGSVKRKVVEVLTAYGEQGATSRQVHESAPQINTSSIRSCLSHMLGKEVKKVGYRYFLVQRVNHE